MRRLWPALALVALAACRCDTPPGDALVSCQSTQVLPSSVQTDILFVIDDSGSMSDNQQNLASNLGAFIDALAASPVQNDFRIAVTNSSVDDFNGSTTYAGGPFKGNPYPAGAMVAVTAGQPGLLIYDSTKYAATAGWGGDRILDKGASTLVADFDANVHMGSSGSGKEQPMRAARLALTTRLADANGGFLRDGARLALVILTDDDDCSESTVPTAVNTESACHAAGAPLDSVQGFADFLRGPIGGELRDVTVGIIAGLDQTTLQPARCTNGTQTAEGAGTRYATLAGILGPQRTVLGSICDASFHDTLLKFAQTLLPDTLPLAQPPADWRMLIVSVTKTDGTVKGCTIGHAGDANQNTVDAIYSDPQFGKQATILFQNACKLDLGDKIDIKVVCAG